jgi:hypothetical protein
VHGQGYERASSTAVACWRRTCPLQADDDLWPARPHLIYARDLAGDSSSPIHGASELSLSANCRPLFLGTSGLILMYYISNPSTLQHTHAIKVAIDAALRVSKAFRGAMAAPPRSGAPQHVALRYCGMMSSSEFQRVQLEL